MTLDLLRPVAAANLRTDHCVLPSCGFSCTFRHTFACTFGVAVRGLLPLCLGSSTSIPDLSNRRFRREIVRAVVCNSRLIALYVMPSANARIKRTRNTSPAGKVRDCDRRVNLPAALPSLIATPDIVPPKPRCNSTRKGILITGTDYLPFIQACPRCREGYRQKFAFPGDPDPALPDIQNKEQSRVLRRDAWNEYPLRIARKHRSSRQLCAEEQRGPRVVVAILDLDWKFQDHVGMPAEVRQPDPRAARPQYRHGD